MAYEYIERFKRLGFGLFCHFGLYSKVSRGEWALHIHKLDQKAYTAQMDRFTVDRNWAKKLVAAAKRAGCKYITLTTRHHDGFSLYDTCGLNEFDAPHSACGRDLVREFTDACNAAGILPFFYHTLLDWHHPDYNENFPQYVEYLIASVEILCKNYGTIGGFWFDGFWDKPDADWQFDRLYATIRTLQPEAMIINNTGLSALGEVSHPEIDSVTFERGKPGKVDVGKKPIAGEMCQVMNDHWGYAKNDCNYKPLREFIENLVDCRRCNCNYLLNVGPMGNGNLSTIDKGILEQIGKWIRANKGFIYSARTADITANGADILYDGEYYYAVIKDVSMHGDSNVQLTGDALRYFTVDANVKDVRWLDSGEKLSLTPNGYFVAPFAYGTSLSVRVARFKLA